MMDDKQAREKMAVDDIIFKRFSGRHPLLLQEIRWAMLEYSESLSAQVAALTENLQLAEEAITQHNRLATDYRDLLVAAEAQVAELKKDAERLDWLDRVMFEGKWDGTIGRPKSWSMAGPYRHELVKMRGASLREAIDAAKESGVSP